MTATPESFVDALNSAFGKQTTQRSAHAKGIVLRVPSLTRDTALLGLIGFGGQVGHAADCTARAALSNSAGLM